MSSNARWRRRPEGSNWGDFGADDQLGRMNLLTPERRLAAIAEAKTGVCFSLSLPLDLGASASRKPPVLAAATDVHGAPAYNKPTGIGVDKPRGVVCDDVVTLHTQYSTQWDSLAHWGRHFDADDDGAEEIVYYNGYRAGEHLVAPSDGRPPQARALGIEHLAETGAQGRAVVISLLDAFGPRRTWVGMDELEHAMNAQGASVRTGDFLLLHTGMDDALLASPERPVSRQAIEGVGAVLDGRDPRLLQWVADSGVVALCSDNIAVEGFGFADGSAGDHSMLPLHDLCLFKLGIHLGELWRLGDLSRWLRKAGRSACLLTAPPLRLPGAVGSPVTPVATV
jgi:kynurenine formamidase